MTGEVKRRAPCARAGAICSWLGLDFSCAVGQNELKGLHLRECRSASRCSG